MSDQTAVTNNDVVIPPVLFLEITLPLSGTSLRINKLRSKAHYEAQKVYADWIRELQNIAQAGLIDTAKVADENGSVDLKQFEGEYKDIENKRVSLVLEKSDSLVKTRLLLISLCLGVPSEKIEEDYYPEDLDFILGKCLELNKFMDNLKKSVAPTAGIGV